MSRRGDYSYSKISSEGSRRNSRPHSNRSPSPCYERKRESPPSSRGSYYHHHHRPRHSHRHHDKRRRSRSRSRSPYRKKYKSNRTSTPSRRYLHEKKRAYSYDEKKRDDSDEEVKQEEAPYRLLGYPGNPKYSFLPIEWWDRNEDCSNAKSEHVARIDELSESREQLVLDTTLWKEDPALEPNMFPYDTPPGVAHYTLWSRRDLSRDEIVSFVEDWMAEHFPAARRWQYDDNLGERSILLFHVHVFLETQPYCFTPRDGHEYIPPHMKEPL